MRKRGGLLATAAVAVVVLGFGAIYIARAHQPPGSSGSLGSANSGPYPGLHGQITPECPGKTLTTQGWPGILAKNTCTPSFAAQDVRDYLARGFSMGKIGITGKPTVTRVLFLTIQELGQVTGDSEWEANYPGNLLVCYVGLSGTFSVAGAGGRVATRSTASLVFDAHTGNGLVMGTPDALAGRV